MLHLLLTEVLPVAFGQLKYDKIAFYVTCMNFTAKYNEQVCNSHNIPSLLSGNS